MTEGSGLVWVTMAFVVVESSVPAAWRRMMRRLVRRAAGDGGSKTLNVVICGGSLDEWASRSDENWNRWVTEIGEMATRDSVGSITVYPVTGATDARLERRRWTVAGVDVTVVPYVDGRRRLADVVDAWPTGLALTEETLGRALEGPSGEPDVVVVVDAPGRLPTALVWELAYAELVDVGVDWESFSGDHLVGALAEFRTRHRRFGGLVADEET